MRPYKSFRGVLGSMSDGKQFEQEVAQSFKQLPHTWTISGNERLPVCDRIAVVNGIPFLAECKECSQPFYKFERTSERERNLLSGAHNAGVISLMLFKRTCSKPRAWGVLWEDYLELEEAMGFTAPWLLRRDQKNKRGSSRLVLEDQFIPPTFVELERVSRKDFRGGDLGKHWDFWKMFTDLAIPPISALSSRRLLPFMTARHVANGDTRE